MSPARRAWATPREASSRCRARLLRAVCNHYFDMAPDTIGESTFCCGGGGGLLTDDLVELRVKGALPRMQAFKEVVERNEVTHIAAICAICKSQFAKVLPYYGIRDGPDPERAPARGRCNRAGRQRLNRGIPLRLDN